MDPIESSNEAAVPIHEHCGRDGIEIPVQGEFSETRPGLGKSSQNPRGAEARVGGGTGEEVKNSAISPYQKADGTHLDVRLDDDMFWPSQRKWHSHSTRMFGLSTNTSRTYSLKAKRMNRQLSGISG